MCWGSYFLIDYYVIGSFLYDVYHASCLYYFLGVLGTECSLSVHGMDGGN